MILALASRIKSSFPTTNNNNNNHKTEYANIYAKLSLPQAQRYLYQTITMEIFEKELHLIPTTVTAFLPSILSPSQALHYIIYPEENHSTE
jgi:hypothetical protein